MPNNPNELALESSPYLLQHAHNPVNWRVWSKETLAEAKKQHKLLIISVGYAACHWCHVMEQESFEDKTVANIMNADYIAIKVDREERPDIDQVYMQAIQIMTGKGGWPMNVVALPDGRPVWGGTYFPKEQWKSALQQIQHLYKTQPDQLYNYAVQLEKGLHKINLVTFTDKTDSLTIDIEKCIETWKQKFDKKEGGTGHAPKFMMPNNLTFLMRYAYQKKDSAIKNFVLNTLDKIVYGGVFDPVDGGFSRYSVDDKWHIPHFEKMLYDNAQLLSVYSNAYKITEKKEYEEAVKKTIEFIETEFTDSSGAFYTALDADSENEKGLNEEGAFYSWTKTELEATITSHFTLFCSFFNINTIGYWENSKYVLYRTQDELTFAEKNNLSLSEFSIIKNSWIADLKKVRENRKKPLLDDKTLTSWNAMTILGLLDAYSTFQDPAYLKLAKKNADFLKNQQINSDFRLYRTYKSGQSKINGYLEDYAFTIAAFLRLHEVTFEDSWLYLAKNVTEYTLNNFYDTSQNLFYFSNKNDTQLITNPKEYLDNVIPSSNSEMAKNLNILAKHFPNSGFKEIPEKMVKSIVSEIYKYPNAFSNWLQVYLNMSESFFEISITGINAQSFNLQLQQNYLPNCIFTGSTSVSELPLLQHRFHKENTQIYVCEEGKCLQPETDIAPVLQKIKSV